MSTSDSDHWFLSDSTSGPKENCTLSSATPTDCCVESVFVVTFTSCYKKCEARLLLLLGILLSASLVVTFFAKGFWEREEMNGMQILS